MSGRIRLECIASNRWRVSVVCYSGKVAAVEGDLASVARLAARAERLFEHYAHNNAARTTVPPPRRTVRPRAAKAASERRA